MPDEAILSRASIYFQTNDDDKDDDTDLHVAVRLMDGTDVATIDNNFGTFPNNTEVGPYDLQIIGAPTKGGLKHGSVYIRIQPNGNDTWRFGFFLDLLFDDRTHLIARASGLELTESPPQQAQSFGIE
jgi:hypothetical protein